MAAGPESRRPGARRALASAHAVLVTPVMPPRAGFGTPVMPAHAGFGTPVMPAHAGVVTPVIGARRGRDPGHRRTPGS